MAGIYIHVPFCKKKCSYCDFYSDTNLGITEDLIKAKIIELQKRKNYLGKENVETIYLGGGTPSLLRINQIKSLLSAIYENYNVNNDCEVTFECNPDDLSNEYIKKLKMSGINRISIGVQSFNNEVLKFLGRRHSAEQAKNTVIWAKEEGFNNISVDLIFGIPGSSFEYYKKSLDQAIDLGVQHISSYQLTYEGNTPLNKKLLNKEFNEVDEEELIEQFEYTISYLGSNGFNQYEVSNYAIEGFMSKHNWLYWTNEKYLGVGPSAHSYNGNSRQWNTYNNDKYIHQINSDESHFTIENLSEVDKYNEYILTGLRTIKGISFEFIQRNFNKKIKDHFLNTISKFIDESFIKEMNCNYTVSKKGLNILDFIVNKLNYI